MTGKVHYATGIVFGIGAAYVAHKYFSGNPEIMQYGKAMGEIVSENLTIGSLELGKFVVGDIVRIIGIILLCGIGSLLPDIDHPTSTFSKKYFLLSIPFRILQLIFGNFKATKHFVGHRGITHSILFAIIFIVPIFFIDNIWIVLALLSLAIGIISHLLMDMLNPTGVPLLLPFTKKKFRLLPKKIAITTGWYKGLLFFTRDLLVLLFCC